MLEQGVESVSIGKHLGMREAFEGILYGKYRRAEEDLKRCRGETPDAVRFPPSVERAVGGISA